MGTLNVCYFDWSCICVNSCLVWTACVFHFLWGLEFFISKWGWWEPSGLACLRFWGAYCLSFLSCCQNCQCIEFSDLSLASNYFIFTLYIYSDLFLLSCSHLVIYSFFHTHSFWIWFFFILNYGLLPFLPCLPSEVYHCVSISAFFAFWILDWMGQISGEYSCLSAFFAFTA